MFSCTAVIIGICCGRGVPRNDETINVEQAVTNYDLVFYGYLIRIMEVRSGKIAKSIRKGYPRGKHSLTVRELAL